jgi:uncharacterized protein (DUF885 family)
MHRFISVLALPALLLFAAMPAQAGSLPAQKSRDAQANTGEQASARLAALADRYYDASARLDPLAATYLGDSRFNDKLGIPIAPAQRASLFRLNRDMLQALARIDQTRLSAKDATTYALLRYMAEDILASERFNDHLLPIHHMESVPVALANLASGQSAQPLRTVKDYDAYLRRISMLPAWIDQAMANMQQGMRMNIVQPKALMASALPQLRSIAAGPAEKSAYYAPVRQMPAGFSAADRTRLTAAYRASINDKILPSLQKLVAFIERDYLPACRETSGLGALPDGADWYRNWVRSHTTLPLSPDDIHEMGLKEVARIHAEMAKAGAQLGYNGDPGGLAAWMDEQPRFRPFRTDKEVLDGYRALNDRIKTRLPELFSLRPKARLEIRPEPELTRATASDHYDPPSSDGTRPGTFWTVITDPAQYEAPGMTSLFLHEGQPGHHFQMALQQELPLPAFRRFGGNNAFIEGWALYAETLGHELGLYGDPAAYAGHLRAELHRAVRLVTDTGLHAKGWSREQTMDYMRKTQGLTEAAARRSTERYMAVPGQALSYKIGSMKIAELRRRAADALGDRFLLAAFHDVVLEDAALPMPLLESKIDRWIAQRNPMR